MNTDGLVKPQMSHFAQTTYESKYAWKDDNGNPTENWYETAERVVSNVLGALGYSPGDADYDTCLRLVQERKFMPGGRYLYASGRGLHQTQNCLLLKPTDDREGWAELMFKSGMALMTGAGIGADYSDLRESGAPIKKTGGEASGPISLMTIINEIGRNVMQGGARRSAIWAGLNWKHPDIFKFIRAKDWSPEVRAMKAQDFTFPAALDMTNISVILDDDFFAAFEDEKWLGWADNADPTTPSLAPDGDTWHSWAHRVYLQTIKKMLKTGEPGFSIDTGDNAGETLRNACTEVTSYDDSDVCNLGSINLGAIDSLAEFEEAVQVGTLFLLAGTVYSHLPYEKVEIVRSQNRRLGLGLMGVAEWLYKRGKPYGPDGELQEWMEAYAQSTEIAHQYADHHGISRPVKTRAVAPTGTIAIVAETTSGMEPLFCVAYKRRIREASAEGKDRITYQYVVDPTAKRLADQGVDVSKIDDAYRLSYDVERRVAFQAWIQQYVDHGISSTINLPGPITDPSAVMDFSKMLMKYLPKLRGITAYPDGARDGQPLTAVPYHVAIEQVGVVFEEDEEKCIGGICGL